MQETFTENFKSAMNGQPIITHLTDCSDDEATMRLEIRTQAIFGIKPIIKPVTTGIQASGFLINAIDAAMGKPLIAMVNIARRETEKNPPFGFFWYGPDTLIITSISDEILSLVKKYRLTPHINLIDIPEMVEAMNRKFNLLPDQPTRILKTQFRSYEFLPLAAFFLYQRQDKLRYNLLSMEKVKELNGRVWWNDNFGNMKLTIMENEIRNGKIRDQKVAMISPTKREFPFYESLMDVPQGVTALVVGSSGLKNARLCEFVKMGGSAEEELSFLTDKEIKFG